jgi:hypothetical protein
MAEEHAAAVGINNLPPNNIFVYTGEQDVPFDVTHVRIDRSVKIIPARAFYRRANLVSVETHDGIEKIEQGAFYGCWSLRGIKLSGVREIEDRAFACCFALSDVEFGNKLETIGEGALNNCRSLQKIKIPTVETIEVAAFGSCERLTDAEFGVKLERIEDFAFADCPRLQRIAIPLKDNMFTFDTFLQRYTQFDSCENLTTVDLVGVEGIRKSISWLMLESWRNEMNEEIDRINQLLPNAPSLEKTAGIQEWIESVIDRIKHYKAEHNRLLKEDMAQLELALWKAKLDEKEQDKSILKVPAKKAKIDVESMRKERRIMSGASIVIKNVLPFLQLG